MSDDDDSDKMSINSTDTLPEEDAINVKKLKNSIELYKEKLYNRIIPNDENGPSQTNAPEEQWQTIQANDANILLDNCQIDGLSKEANEFLKSFFCGNMNVNESINFRSIVRLSLMTFPNVMKLAHALELNNSNQ